jgi:SlyX protein
MTEDRLDRLEAHVAQQDQVIDDLSDVLARQTREIDQLKARLMQADSKIAELEAAVEKGGVKGMAAKNTLDQLRAQDETSMNAIEARIAACPADRQFWARDAENAVHLARRHLAEADSHLPRSLGPGQSRDVRLSRVRQLLTLYGGLMEAWPGLMSAAADLRAETAVSGVEKTLSRAF